MQFCLFIDWNIEHNMCAHWVCSKVQSKHSPRTHKSLDAQRYQHFLHNKRGESKWAPKLGAWSWGRACVGWLHDLLVRVGSVSISVWPCLNTGCLEIDMATSCTAQAMQCDKHTTFHDSSTNGILRNRVVYWRSTFLQCSTFRDAVDRFFVFVTCRNLYCAHKLELFDAPPFHVEISWNPDGPHVKNTNWVFSAYASHDSLTTKAPCIDIYVWTNPYYWVGTKTSSWETQVFLQCTEGTVYVWTSPLSRKRKETHALGSHRSLTTTRSFTGDSL